MPISHHHKIVFIHIPKTGGSSIEKALGVYSNDGSGNNDVENTDILFGNELQHLRLAEIEDRFTPSVLKGYRYITCVRNPFDRIVSEYRWRNPMYSENRPFTDFDSFVEYVRQHRNEDPHLRPQVDFLLNKEGEIPDKLEIMYFERLSQDFKELIGRKAGRKLPLLNQTKPKPYWHYYKNPSIKTLVYKMYEEDFQAFSYRFKWSATAEIKYLWWALCARLK